MNDVIAVILGGGRGTRLSPLTRYRSKPAVPIAGSYRLVDVAVSNCIHGSLRRIFVITQYESESLNRHITDTYTFDAFSEGFIRILAAEQTEIGNGKGGDGDWFRGTADAIRKCMKHLRRESWSKLVVLSGDQLYRMNLSEMLEAHREKKADVTVAMKVVPAELTSAFGIMKVDDSGRVVHFEEKPKADRLGDLASKVPGVTGPAYLASMGIYVFEREALESALETHDHLDFGKHVLPGMLSHKRVQAFLYDGYWEDVGTIRSYFDANLALTGPEPPFSFYHPRWPIYTQRPFLAPSIIHGSRIDDALVADGCFLDRVDIHQAVVGIRMRIGSGTRIRRSLLLGADTYELPNQQGDSQPLGIGANSVIENAIVDKNARIGRDVRIVNERGLKEHESSSYVIREGIVVIPKGAVVPDGTRI
jgi:glucose-1-phosphate adenylyltransferase